MGNFPHRQSSLQQFDPSPPSMLQRLRRTMWSHTPYIGILVTLLVRNAIINAAGTASNIIFMEQYRAELDAIEAKADEIRTRDSTKNWPNDAVRAVEKIALTRSITTYVSHFVSDPTPLYVANTVFEMYILAKADDY